MAAPSSESPGVAAWSASPQPHRSSPRKLTWRMTPCVMMFISRPVETPLESGTQLASFRSPARSNARSSVRPKQSPRKSKRSVLSHAPCLNLSLQPPARPQRSLPTSTGNSSNPLARRAWRHSSAVVAIASSSRTRNSCERRSAVLSRRLIPPICAGAAPHDRRSSGLASV